jgi:hypothetical protein
VNRIDPGTASNAPLSMDQSAPAMNHLDDAQFTDLLLGIASREVTAHLDLCPQCREEASRVSGALGSFETQTRLWAEQRAATTPRLTAPAPALSWFHHPASSWAAAAVAVLLVFGLALRGTNHPLEPHQPQPTAAAAAPLSPATLESDNALLAAIDSELRTDDAPSSDDYGLNLTAHPSHSKPARQVSN